MNKTGVAVIIVMLALLAFAGCSRDVPVEPGKASENADAKAFKTVYSGSVDEGDATVDLTPVGVVDGKLRINIGVNTHSVSLESFDLTEITLLEYNGKSVAPESAPALRGHHNSGTLVFETGEDISKFRITIRGIPNVDERVFEWG